MDLGQGHGSNSKSNYWCAAVDVRGWTLPSAAKSNDPKSVAKKSHYQSKVFVCVSVISSADAVDRPLIIY